MTTVPGDGRRVAGMRRRGLVVALLLLPAIAVIGYESLRNGTTVAADGDSEVRVPGELAGFRIDGGVDHEVVPGSSAAIDLRLDNPHPFALAMSVVVVRVSGVDAPRADHDHACGTTDFAVRQLLATRTFVVPAASTVRLSDLGVAPASWPTLAMVDRETNQDGCKGASVRLSFTATGKRK